MEERKSSKDSPKFPLNLSTYIQGCIFTTIVSVFLKSCIYNDAMRNERVYSYKLTVKNLLVFHKPVLGASI